MNKEPRISSKASKRILIRYVIGLILSLSLFVVFLDFALQVRGKSGGIYFDELIISSVSKLVTPGTKSFMVFISFLGSAKFYIPACIIIIFYLSRKKYYISIIGLINGVLGSAILNFILKIIFTRTRPEDYFQIIETGYSFPSGHSMVAISAYFTLTYIFIRKRHWDIRKILIWLVTGMFVFLIGFSRIYLGVHWPTDVLAGFSVGFIWVFINIIIIEILNRKYKKQSTI